jgi:hypothetical protein
MRKASLEAEVSTLEQLAATMRDEHAAREQEFLAEAREVRQQHDADVKDLLDRQRVSGCVLGGGCII